MAIVPLATTTKALSNKSPEPMEQVEEVTNDPCPPLEKEPTLKDVFVVVSACQGSLKELCDQMKGVKEDLILVRQDLQKTAERTTALEGRTSQLEDDILPLIKEVKNMKEQMARYTSKMDELENRNRRDNVRMVGLPEKSKGPNPIELLEKWLVEFFGRESFSTMFTIERAHRVPFRAPPAGGYPRPLLTKFLNCKDKVTLLRKAREAGNIFFNGTRISLYPDFSPELQRRRAEFIQIKHTLQKFKLSYALLYPARLRVTALGSNQFFDSPTSVEKWLEENKEKL